MNALAPLLTPHGRLTLEPAEDDALALAEDVAGRLSAAFARGHGHGLLQLGAGEVKTALPPAIAYWREFASRFVAALCALPDAEDRNQPRVPCLGPLELETLAAAAPPMTGGEYVSGDVLRALWESMEAAFHDELAAAKTSVQEFLKAKNPAWNLVGRVLEALRKPEALAAVDPGSGLRATLRPYQQAGLRWLHLLSSLGLGACLADDMGLGKTMQVLALLLVLRAQGESAHPRDGGRNGGRRASLLVAPASLVANWEAEIARFAPTLKTLVAHPSAMPSAELRVFEVDRAVDADVVLTTYGTLLRAPRLLEARWRLAILDEAQAIKNPGARQTRAVKQIDALARIASPGLRWKTGSATCGRSSISSTRGFSVPRRNSDKSRNAWRRGNTTRTGRCGSWCARTSCGGSRQTRT